MASPVLFLGSDAQITDIPRSYLGDFHISLTIDPFNGQMDGLLLHLIPDNSLHAFLYAVQPYPKTLLHIDTCV